MAQKKQKSERSLVSKIVGWIGNIVLLGILVGLVMMLFGMKKVHDEYERVRTNIENVANIDEIPKGSQATRVYARDYDPETGEGTLLAALFEENRQQVDFYDMPPALIACIMSTEDANFYNHKGIDYRGLARAGRNIVMRGGEIHGGGSTITMQLSRNVFLPYIKSEKTMNRKVQEIIFSSALEKRFTKQEIMEAYCNHNYLGAHSHGVKSAAKSYFNKELGELTLSECAVIAGLLQLPSKYNPKKNPDGAKGRRNEVLNLLKTRVDTDFFDMLAKADPEMFEGFTITGAEINAALAEDVVTVEQDEPSAMKAPYFTSYVRERLYDRYGTDQVLRQGMSIVTTLDPLYQQWAEEIIKEKIDKYRDSKRVSQAALILIEAGTGEVLACVGGYEWGYQAEEGDLPDKYNRAMLGGRPVGSSMKAFTYATAYEQGFSPSMTIFDGPNLELTAKFGKPWPTNSSMDYWGWTSIATAMQYSRNAAAVDLLVNCTGAEPVIETARKMGITAHLEPVPALTLGPYDIKPVEMAEAFDTFSNMGVHVDSIILKKVYDQKGMLMEANDGDIHKRSNRAFSANTAWMMVQNMIRVVEAGTAPNARVRGVEIKPGEKVSVQVAGKTGTNDDWADAWFVGYTPELVCAVWYGNDDYSLTMRRMFGGDAPAETFSALLKKVYSCQYETIGEGETAVEMLVYEPRYTQAKFKKPSGATFNGFANLVRGSGLEVEKIDNEWKVFLSEDYVPPEGIEVEEEDGEDESDVDEEDDFYHQWQPPPEHHVYF